MRDYGLLESALARAPNLAMYAKPDHAELAGGYGHGIARNHPFVDGNKRRAFVAVELFLPLNGYELVGRRRRLRHDHAALRGRLDAAAVAAWIRKHARSTRRRQAFE